MAWTGFADFTKPSADFERGKTLWDWMQLLVIPIFLTVGVLLLNRSEQKTERQIATDRQQEAILQAYLDKMSELLLEKKLLTTDEKEPKEVARIQTLTVLRGLDAKRKALVVRFLHEAGLIHVKNVIIDLYGADLGRADLRWSDLNAANLSGTSLFEADLDSAQLANANLEGANLRGANLTVANLSGANLAEAGLKEANLEDAWAINTNFQRADLDSANLSFAYMYGANFEHAYLRHAKLEHATLTSANLRDVNLSDAALQGANLTKEINQIGLFRILTPFMLTTPMLSGEPTDAKLDHVVLNNANLKNCLITKEQLESVNADWLLLEGAIMPDGKRYKEKNKTAQ